MASAAAPGGAAAGTAAGSGDPAAEPESQALGPTATYTLLDGRKMPVIGFGVYRVEPGPETATAVRTALELGYRLIDTAMLYRNERSVGEAVRDSGLRREDVWITTKLWDTDHGYESTLAACQKSLRELGMDYVDLYLIHSPNRGKLVETWDALVELRRRGWARSIGVSNFDVKHLKALADHGREVPAVNQFEMHPLVYRERKALVDYCAERGILVQAYGSLFSGNSKFLEDRAVVQALANHPGKTAGQVLLRWALQQGFQVIPKSTKRARIEENLNIFDFELTDAEVQRLSSMRGRLGVYWNPLTTAVDVGKVDL